MVCSHWHSCNTGVLFFVYMREKNILSCSPSANTRRMERKKVSRQINVHALNVRVEPACRPSTRANMNHSNHRRWILLCAWSPCASMWWLFLLLLLLLARSHSRHLQLSNDTTIYLYIRLITRALRAICIHWRSDESEWLLQAQAAKKWDDFHKKNRADRYFSAEQNPVALWCEVLSFFFFQTHNEKLSDFSQLILCRIHLHTYKYITHRPHSLLAAQHVEK